MSNIKISQLNNATTPLAGTEVVPIVQSGSTKKVTVQDIADLASGGSATGVHSLIKFSSGDVTNSSLNATTTNTIAIASNRLTSLPYIPNQTITCQNLYINVTNAIASSNCRILIYSDLDGKPDQKLYESANLDTSTIGIKTAITTFTFNLGQIYWLTIHSNLNPTLSGLGVGSLIPIKIQSTSLVSGYSAAGTFGSAPTTYPSPANITTTVPQVFITIA